MTINATLFICFFTFMIQFTETIVYGMRLSGLRTRQMAIAMSFVTTSLIVSRLSNMFQAPLLGTKVDAAIMIGTPAALTELEFTFRLIIFAGFLGVVCGSLLTRTTVTLFEKAIQHFLVHGSIPKIVCTALKPRSIMAILRSFRLPSFSALRLISLKDIPKQFLIFNIILTSCYSIGVLCSLLAGAYLPEIRSTANQLSGIVNGIATILMTIFVDPSGARITDQTFHGNRPESHVVSVIFFMQMGKLLGTLLIAQLLFWPFTKYVMFFTELLAGVFI